MLPYLNINYIIYKSAYNKNHIKINKYFKNVVGLKKYLTMN